MMESLNFPPFVEPKIQLEFWWAGNQQLIEKPCRNCKGKGYIGEYRCPSCHGSGRALTLIHRRLKDYDCLTNLIQN